VVAGRRSVVLTRVGDDFGALDNRCPHQGGPLGEGSIENGLLRCPWHGFDYCPLDGKSPGFDDEAVTYGVEPELMDRPVVQVAEPGKVYARDEFVHWGFSGEGLARLARHAGFAGFELADSPSIDGHPRLLGTMGLGE
jgi:nitrite reductase/ring-hydroxylating ferredoxin subunit